MTTSRHTTDCAPTSRRPFRSAGRTGAAIVGAAGLTLGISIAALASALPVPEGDAAPFALLASSTITNTNTSTVDGDIGVHPGSEITGYDDGANSVVHTGELHLADGVAEDAQVSATNAYNSADGQGADQTFPTAQLAGMTLTGGVYDSLTGDFNNSGTLTLDAEGDPSTVWVFQMESTLVTGSGSSVELINGASSCNVYWVVGSSATLGSGSTLVGTVMADQSITMNSGATLYGRAWALDAAITLDNNVIDTTCVLGATTDTGSDDDDTTDDTTGGDTTSGDTTSDDTTSAQVTNPPAGGVATGDGSTRGGPVSLTLVAGMAAALYLFTALAALLRKRRTALARNRTLDRA